MNVMLTMVDVIKYVLIHTEALFVPVKKVICFKLMALTVKVISILNYRLKFHIKSLLINIIHLKIMCLHRY